MSTFLIVLIICTFILLIISYFVAKSFWEISKMKGYSENKYFWWCFLGGICGWMMVIALPDKSAKTRAVSFDSDELPNL